MTRVIAFWLALLLPVAAAAEQIPFQRGSWQELLAAHAGRPLAVHLWSLTCAPCLAELPQWGRLAAERPELALVMLSTDPPDQSARISQVLARSGLDAVESWSFADTFTARLRHEIDPSWRGELPRTLLVAADGSVQVLKGAAGTRPVTDWLALQPNPSPMKGATP